jgi:hypothetical protein
MNNALNTLSQALVRFWLFREYHVERVLVKTAQIGDVRA